jgi:hypothetical protein
MRYSIRLIIVGIAAAVGAGCADQVRLPATGEVFEDTLVVYALRGSTLNAPTALSVQPLALVPATAMRNYEIAFDIDDAGKGVLLPARLLVTDEAQARRVGLQIVSTPFDQLTTAPRLGYTYDQALTVVKGDVIAVEAETDCHPSYPQVVFGKILIDSIVAARRAIYFRAVSDPSCGFRSLVPGELPRG